MLAYTVSVYRQKDGGASPANFDSPKGDYVAGWNPELLDHLWIQGVVQEGNGIDLGGNGYPFRLTVRAEHLLPILEETPPHYIEKDVVASCRPDEWLLIEVWDQS
jgi:hypothetical protein